MLVRHATVDDMAAIQALVDWGPVPASLCHAMRKSSLSGWISSGWLQIQTKYSGSVRFAPLPRTWLSSARSRYGQKGSGTAWAAGSSGRALTGRDNGGCTRFALTFHPAYFEQLGFYRVEAQQAPPDVWEAYVQPAKTLVGNESVLRYDLRRVSGNL